MPPTRQLAAIMFADIVGYTAMMQEDEVLAINWRQKLKRKLEDEVKAHQGRILEFRGDGAMCSFISTIEGVRAAVALQLNMRSEPVIPLRIGIHTGDVIFEENNIYGDGVNIASRLESFALPGSIFISGKVHDDIKNQKDIQSISLGKFALKNVKNR
jgi:class 3 adenylate cyclase